MMNEQITLEHTACPLCDADEPKPMWSAPDRLYGCAGEFSLVRCSSCRHVYLNPRPTASCISEFYPHNYGPHQEQSPAAAKAPESQQSDHAKPWYLSRPVRAVPGLRTAYHWLKETKAELIPPVDSPEPQALELGCAGGRFLERLRQAGWTAQGLEMADDPAQAARAKGFRVHTGTLQPGRFPPQRFDAVFAWMLVEHLPDPRTTLREVWQILKPGGWLVLSVPNFACWEPRVFGTYWYALQLPTHYHQFSPRSIRKLLAGCGFEQVRVIHQRNVLNLIGSLGLWLRAHRPQSQLGPRFIQFTDSPSMWGQLALAPLAKVLAWLHQGGRLTVSCRRGAKLLAE